MSENLVALYAIYGAVLVLSCVMFAAEHKPGALYGIKHVALLLLYPVFLVVGVGALYGWTAVAMIVGTAYSALRRKPPNWVLAAPGGHRYGQGRSHG